MFGFKTWAMSRAVDEIAAYSHVFGFFALSVWFLLVSPRLTPAQGEVYVFSTKLHVKTSLCGAAVLIG